jgi:WD40 repeat protein
MNAKSIKTKTGHAAVLKNSYLASGAINGEIRIWNTEKSSLIRTIRAHSTSEVFSLAVLRNGDLVSCGGQKDRQVKIWNLSTGKSEDLLGHMSWIQSLAVLPNGYLAAGGFDRKIIIWNTNNKNLTGETDASDAPVQSLALVNDFIASAYNNNFINIWNKTDMSLVRILKGHADWVFSLAVLPNGYLASGSRDRTIKIWNTTDGSLIRTLPVNSVVYSLAILRNGFLASGSADNTIKIWNTNNGSLVRTLTGHSDYVVSLAVLPNGYLASGSDDATIKIWNTNNGSLIRTLTGHTGTVLSLAALPNGYLASDQ